MHNKIALPRHNGISIINTDKIILCKTDGNYTLVIKEGEQPIRVQKRISFLEGVLPRDHFFRCNKSYIINLNYVKELCRQNRCVVTMENDTEVEVSHRKRPLFFQRLELKYQRKSSIGLLQ